MGKTIAGSVHVVDDNVQDTEGVICSTSLIALKEAPGVRLGLIRQPAYRSLEGRPAAWR